MAVLFDGKKRRKRAFGALSSSSSGGLTPRRQCYGMEFDPNDRECHYVCPWRKECERKFNGDDRTRSKSSSSKVPTKSGTSTPTQEDDYPDIVEVPAEEDQSMFSVYVHNGLLAAAEEMGHELIYMIRSVPRREYDFTRSNKEKVD